MIKRMMTVNLNLILTDLCTLLFAPRGFGVLGFWGFGEVGEGENLESLGNVGMWECGEFGDVCWKYGSRVRNAVESSYNVFDEFNISSKQILNCN